MRGIVDWIMEAQAGGGTAPEAETGSVTTDAGGGAGATVPERALRFTVQLVDLPGLDTGPAVAERLRGRRFLIVDDGRGVALHLAALLEELEATAQLVPAGSPAPTDPFDGLIDLTALASASTTTALDAFPALRQAALAGAQWIVAASAMGGSLGRDEDRPPADAGLPAGAGMPGLCRSLAHELPAAQVRAIDLDPKEEASSLAGALLGELLSSAGPSVVGRVGDRRTTTVAVLDDRPRSEQPVALDAEAVMVLTGGARGVTARIAQGLADRYRGRIVLLGRSPLSDEPEDPALADAADGPALRRALVESGIREPKVVETRLRQIQANREIRANLAALGSVAAEVTYHSTDVRDPAALRGLLDEVRSRYGRLDLVVHGAGVLEDKLVRDKTPESFASVFGTKVDGALTLAQWQAERADAGEPSTLVLMGSVSGVFGNRGQTDYAAANDALDTLAHRVQHRPGLRVLSVDWGPWAGGGMVSPELERLYLSAGVGLLDPDDAVGRLIDELESPDHGAAQVVVMRCQPDAFDRAR